MRHRRLSTLLLPLAALLCVWVQAASEPAPSPAAKPDTASADTSPFARTRSYNADFFDVPAGSWYAAPAASAYEYGLLEGRGSGQFAPNDSITVAELFTLSARLSSIYEGGDPAAVFPRSAEPSDWFRPYLSYLSERGLLTFTLDDYGVPATRAQMAAIFSRSLPDAWYDDRNAQLIADAYASRDFITDVTDYTPYQMQILWMYRQGLLVGVDAQGSFHPQNCVTRAEIAALLTRIVEPGTRLTPDRTVLPYHSAVGATLSSIVDAPASVPSAPDFQDTAAIDAIIRQALAAGQSSVMLTYNRVLTAADAAALAKVFTAQLKTYCEQMYNTVTCRAYSTGRAYLYFSSGACTNEQLHTYRDLTVQRAIEVHDMLWETGALTYGMSEYEIARTYYAWLCDNCRYDSAASDTSLSHTAYGALVKGVAVCDGYTGAYNLLLKLEGIRCRALFNTSHIWTVARLDGIEYHIDTTWGDQFGAVDMSYFGMTAAQSRAKHAW